MNGGYVLLDLKGADIIEDGVTVTGIHSKIADAYKSGKPVVFQNLSVNGDKVSYLTLTELRIYTITGSYLGGTLASYYASAPAQIEISSDDVITISEM